MSWIHADDLVNAIVFALGDGNVFGPVNATAPNPVENAEFARALGSALHRPAVIHTPVFALRLMLGEAADVVLASQRVVPNVLQQAGFTWAHPEIGEAIASIV
jgi:NAD dependent epimerase/dehydratase family enzyme